MRQTSLFGLGGRAAVQLRGRIASPNRVVSPVTRRPAAVLQYYLFVPDDRGGPHDRLIDTGRLGDDLVLETHGGRLLVPLHGIDIYFRGANPKGLPLGRVPEGFATLRGDAGARELAAAGRLFYRELVLVSGQPVRFRGTVTPIVGEGAYRVPYPASFAVLFDAERPTLSADVVELA